MTRPIFFGERLSTPAHGTTTRGWALAGCPDIRPDGIYLDGRRVIRLGLQGAPGADEWDDKPISTVKVEGEGPIYKTADDITMLSPGRYTYSNVLYQEHPGIILTTRTPMPNADAFPDWLDAFKAFVRVTRKAEEQGTVSREAIYVDYEFMVAEPVPWTSNLNGLPTWLPSGIDVVQDYWGRGYRVPEFTLPELPTIPETTGLVKGIGFAAFGIATLVGVVVLANRSDKRKRAA